MKLTILGASAAYPGPNSPCSGHLLQDGDRNVVIDCGSGVLANLQSIIDLRDVSDIFITHMHADHFFDLVPYRYALRYGFNGSGPSSKPALHLPPGGTDVLKRVVQPFAESEEFFSEVFDVSEYNPETPIMTGGVTFKFTPVRHYIPTYAVSATGSHKIGYSSDSGICPELLQVAAGADLFVCTIGRCLGADINHLWGHMLPEEAGKLAKEAGVKRLVITHLWPRCDAAVSGKRASEAFGREVEVARTMQTFTM